MGNITPLKISAFVIGTAAVVIVVVVLLTKKKDTYPTPVSTSGPTPVSTSGPTPGSTPGSTPGGNGGGNGNSIQTLTKLYDANTGIELPLDNNCYNCDKKRNPCACYLNRNCSLSKDKSVIPNICNSIPCLRYETQDENGGAGICNQEGLNLYRNAISNDTNSSNSYLCKTSEDKVRNCQRQCNQHDYPFNSVPFCAGCCAQACSTIDCSNYKPGGPGGTPRPPPSDGGITCEECETLHHMGDAGMMNSIGMTYNQCRSICE